MASPTIHSKLPKVGTTIFTKMSMLAAEYKAINLGQGFPDFMMNPDLIALVNKSMQDGNNQYVHMNGLLSLRERLAEKMADLYDANIHPDSEITITPGGTYAIYTALTTVLRPGDEVIVFEPAYDSYIPNIIINGAIPVLIPLSFPSYSINWQLVKESITSKTKMIVLNSPNNPTGSVLSSYDIEQLRSVVKNTGIFILSDEVYEHLIFDDLRHETMLRYPDLLERSFVCFSFGKTYHCTGWKLGYCVAPQPLMNEFRKVHQFNCFSSHSPVQFALSEFVQQKEQYLQLGKTIQQKRDYFQSLMQQTKFTALPSHGSYFQLYRYEGLSEEKDMDLSVRITKQYGVATIPVSAFYTGQKDDRVIRFCFAKKQTTLEEAVNRLIKCG
ncbi:MAG: aminotransferase class I/II-fold pyridoxal phosphate-dependent enzyme [Ferruginibacter sp.]|uniref:methionine aminotransferase n=1 Tax=Ferruginibacter sp. TaxID=1940288 RepID=UPI002658E3B3|nr:methionine aminotransferase [Ferruginibacter sp.]MDB5275561.1 aminotransferase class I/II-fold pyridoxal phosphate-dependent enzyme [Ferruginibacter sp.]